MYLDVSESDALFLMQSNSDSGSWIAKEARFALQILQIVCGHKDAHRSSFEAHSAETKPAFKPPQHDLSINQRRPFLKKFDLFVCGYCLFSTERRKRKIIPVDSRLETRPHCNVNLVYFLTEDNSFQTQSGFLQRKRPFHLPENNFPCQFKAAWQTIESVVPSRWHRVGRLVQTSTKEPLSFGVAKKKVKKSPLSFSPIYQHIIQLI